jgi:AraC-like DNA-binding protein
MREEIGSKARSVISSRKQPRGLRAGPFFFQRWLKRSSSIHCAAIWNNCRPSRPAGSRARDPVVGVALALLHRKPGHAWTAAALASEAGASRSVLTERFTHLVGAPPLTYLARWRLQLAARKLQTTQQAVLQIAAEVGYESEAAFNRAFKREFGLPPAQYRKALTGSARGSIWRRVADRVKQMRPGPQALIELSLSMALPAQHRLAILIRLHGNAAKLIEDGSAIADRQARPARRHGIPVPRPRHARRWSCPQPRRGCGRPFRPRRNPERSSSAETVYNAICYC